MHIASDKKMPQWNRGLKKRPQRKQSNKLRLEWEKGGVVRGCFKRFPDFGTTAFMPLNVHTEMPPAKNEIKKGTNSN